MKKLTHIFTFLISVLILLPSVSFAAGLVPPCTEVAKECIWGWDELMLLIKNVIDFLIFFLSLPLAAIAFAWAGFLLLTSGGNSSKVTQAKGIFTKVALGLIAAMAAWLIVNTILTTLIDPGKLGHYSLLKNFTGGSSEVDPAGSGANVGSGGGGSCAGASCLDSNFNICGPVSTNCAVSAVNAWEVQIVAAISLAGDISGVNTKKLMKAIIAKESGGNISAGSAVGACGLTQLLPGTAAQYANTCGATDFPTETSARCAWLKKSENATKAICMSIKEIKFSIVPQCGTEVRQIAAGYNGGPGACGESANCGSAAVAGQCSVCAGQNRSTRKWECLYDDNAHTDCNANRASGGKSSYKETRQYAPQVEYCYSQF